ncbi:hypothetical protein MRX96_027059 [Rhipicephalus microplus]
MSNLAAARYQKSWTKRKLKSLSSFASRMQVTILQGASKPSRTLGSLHVLARLPPPSGLVNHRGTIGQGRGGIHRPVILRPHKTCSMPSAFSSTQSLFRGHNLLRDVTLDGPHVGNDVAEVLFEVVVAVPRLHARHSPSSSCTLSNFPGLFEFLKIRLQEANHMRASMKPPNMLNNHPPLPSHFVN